MTTAADLRARADAADTAAYDSFERCDTDGFMSQWASGLTARKLRMEADLLENGGKAPFAGLFKMADDGTMVRVKAKLIDGRYGLCWALMDADGTFTGKFVGAFSKGRRKRAEMGLTECDEMIDAYVDFRGNNATNVMPVHIRKDGGCPADAEVI